MIFVRVEGLVAGLVVSLPALWAAFVVGSLDVPTALLRFLVAVVLFSVAINAVVALLTSYRRAQAAQAARAVEAADDDLPRRRRSDAG